MKKLISLALLTAFAAIADNPPGTNLIIIPLGSYSNSTPFYLGTTTNNPLGWECFSAVNNNFLWASNSIHALQSTITNLTPSSFATTNAPAAGNALRWNGTNLYWAP